MTITDIPTTWQQLMRDVRAVAPDAVMAGGALRDLDNDRPVKDLDIFVNGYGAGDLVGLHRKMLDAGLACDDIDFTKMYPVGETNDVVGFFDISYDGIEQPVQIIVVRCEADLICDRIDFGICRISYDGSTLSRSDEYLEDQAKQVFRLRHDREGPLLVTSIHRYARLCQKYEGWKFELFGDPDPFGAMLG